MVTGFDTGKIALANAALGTVDPYFHSAEAHALQILAASKEVKSKRRPSRASFLAWVACPAFAALLASRPAKNMSSKLSTAQNKQAHIQICAASIFQLIDFLSTSMVVSGPDSTPTGLAGLPKSSRGCVAHFLSA